MNTTEHLNDKSSDSTARQSDPPAWSEAPMSMRFLAPNLSRDGSTPTQAEMDSRPQKNGWAPGHYMSRCRDCTHYMTGCDKYAWQCADCAYADAPATNTDPNVESACAMLRSRAVKGLAKYGRDTAHLSASESLSEARQEASDLIVYLGQAESRVKALEAELLDLWRAASEYRRAIINQGGAQLGYAADGTQEAAEMLSNASLRVDRAETRLDGLLGGKKNRKTDTTQQTMEIELRMIRNIVKLAPHAENCASDTAFGPVPCDCWKAAVPAEKGPTP